MSMLGGCCAAAAIKDLSDRVSALDAMKEFCKRTIAKTNKYGIYTTETDDYGHLETFYVFTSGPPDEGWSGEWDDYGAEFAKFIRRNKLGTIVSPGAKQNANYIEEHDCQIWIWATNRKNLIAWWETDKAGAKERVRGANGVGWNNY